MRVIKHGNTERNVTCEVCGALLAYCHDDIKHRFELDDYSFCGPIHSFSEEWIVCPECSHKIMLSLRIDGKETIK